MIDPKQMNELRHLAQAAQHATDKTPEEAFEEVVQGIKQMPNLLERSLQILLNMQDKFPMPEWGWRQLLDDLRRMSRRRS